MEDITSTNMSYNCTCLCTKTLSATFMVLIINGHLDHKITSHTKQQFHTDLYTDDYFIVGTKLNIFFFLNHNFWMLSAYAKILVFLWFSKNLHHMLKYTGNCLLWYDLLSAVDDERDWVSLSIHNCVYIFFFLSAEKVLRRKNPQECTGRHMFLF